MNEDLICDICNAPFFTDDSQIASEPCHFGRSGGYYCGLCYTLLVALKNSGMPVTSMRMSLLMKYIDYVEDKTDPDRLETRKDLETCDNIIQASELFREDYNGID